MPFEKFELRRLSGLSCFPTFSIVIPAYQAAATIADAVQSALSQTRRPHEVIVVDDGSRDDLLASLGALREEITFIRKDNGGAASARNAGVRVSGADFVAFLDADDVYHPTRLEALAGLVSARPGLDIVTTDTNIVDAQGEVYARFSDKVPFEVTDQRTAILRRCFVGGWPAVRRSRLIEAGGFDETLLLAEDWDCYLRLILRGAAAGFVSTPLYDYRQRAGTLTTNRVQALWGRVRMLERVAENPDLRTDERPVLRESLLYHRTRAAFAEAEVALGEQDPPRGQFLRLAASGIAKRAKLLLLIAAIAPRAGRRWMPPDPGPLEKRVASRARSSGDPRLG